MSDANGGGPRRAKFLTVKEVARELGISERSVWRLIEDWELPTHQFGSSTRIKREDLDAYIERSRRRPSEPHELRADDELDDGPPDPKPR